MFSKTALISLILITAATAASTVDIQLGVTQFYGFQYYETTNKLGYKVDLGYEYGFDNWALNMNVRGIVFPGEHNSFAWYADGTAPFYFSGAPIRVYAAPGLGYSHTGKRITQHGMPPDRSKRDFFRFPLAFGIKAISGSKYLDIRYQLTTEIPLGETTNYYFDEALDFYLEHILEAEFGWAFSKHFGINLMAGVIRGNHAISLNISEDYGFQGYSPYVPFVEIGPSIYF